MTDDSSARPPRPGHGAVFVTLERDGTARAVWQDEHRFASFEGVPDEAVAWARGQPAGRVYLPSGDGRGHIAVPTSEQRPGRQGPEP